MPVISEAIDSRGQTFNGQSKIALKYLVSGTDDDATARAMVLALAPETYGNLPRRECELAFEPIDIWHATVNYYFVDGFSFDTTGGTQKIFQSLETIAKKGVDDDNPAPNCFGAIGVTKDAVEGVDITLPTFKFAYTKTWKAEEITDPYIATLFLLTGQVNNSNFKGFNPGEVLYLGSSGSQKGADNYEIKYEFAGSPNRDTVTIKTPKGDIVIGPKNGWDYLWIRYQDFVDPDANSMTKAPIAAYIERVYRRGDFSLLGLGT